MPTATRAVTGCWSRSASTAAKSSAPPARNADRLRHRAWCVGSRPARDRGGPESISSPGSTRLNAEQAEIHAALDTPSSEDAKRPKKALELVADAWPAFVVQDRYRGIRHYLEALLERDSPPTVGSRASASRRGVHRRQRERLHGGPRPRTACWDLSKRRGFKRELGLAHFVLGLLELFEFNEAAARRQFVKRVEALREGRTRRSFTPRSSISSATTGPTVRTRPRPIGADRGEPRAGSTRPTTSGSRRWPAAAGAPGLDRRTGRPARRTMPRSQAPAETSATGSGSPARSRSSPGSPASTREA